MGRTISFQIPDDELLEAPLWKGLVKYRAGFVCEGCGRDLATLTEVYPRVDKPHAPEKRLLAHHRDRDRQNNRLENGECLCSACHGKEHAKDVAERWRLKKEAGVGGMGA